ncbi:DUF1761 domain-containing protein [Mucilaginibacter sp. RS28]|uniref:DUF1761 domain-containing protein n=1 Tax=Mucilaginibacter straminoryzae TaxID=2932774 RepID=A0A9X1X462_9SPHI|nr:DUF1761 domain-containing protein [Mucilaginibacter straminoryzae]MCJ8209845.1 DUF1761 domain-containing protein [Mucilaginibacter straminoryzae]
MQPVTFNWLAVLIAALSAFFVGGLWFSPILFGNIWLKESGLTREIVATGNKGKIFGMTAVFSFIMAVMLNTFISGMHADLHMSTMIGVHAGMISFSAIAINSLFELKSWKYIFINGGYTLISLILMGLIIGAWK